MPANGTGCAACRQAKPIFAFSMAFQPIIDLEQGRIDGHEALARGPNGEAADFVFAQVNDANRYGFDQTCRVTAIELAARLGMRQQLSINFLPNAVYEPRACIRTTLETAARTGFPLDRLTFEFTEQERIADNQHIRNIIAEYRRHGFKVALDDFATAFSGLSRLVELKPDIVKLDRVLIDGIDTDRHKRVVVAGMCAIARELGIKLVAEGFERAEEIAAARDAGVRFMQGFYFARPAFERVLDDAAVNWSGSETGPVE
jgi:hypothetical protein